MSLLLHSSHRGPAIDWDAAPALRPLRKLSPTLLMAEFEAALAAVSGQRAAQCVHEAWMRGEPSVRVEPMLRQAWEAASSPVPDWLPMTYVEWLPLCYEVCARFSAKRRGRSNLYLVLLDYRDAPPAARGDVAGSAHGSEYGVYVGMSGYAPAQRFEQHKAGIRSAGAVRNRGIEVLEGPVSHLQRIPRAEAADIEVRLAEALGDAGLFVKGGH
ncbi:MAG: hypothetical protein U1F35_20450 [Steroidobacteraceae bacterium]